MAKAPTSPLAAFGLSKELQPTSVEFWNYDRLTICTPDQIIAALKMVTNSNIIEVLVRNEIIALSFRYLIF